MKVYHILVQILFPYPEITIKSLVYTMRVIYTFVYMQFF